MVYRKPKGQPGYCVEAFIKGDEDVENSFRWPSNPPIPDLSSARELYEKMGEKGLAYVALRRPFLRGGPMV